VNTEGRDCSRSRKTTGDVRWRILRPGQGVKQDTGHKIEYEKQSITENTYELTGSRRLYRLFDAGGEMQGGMGLLLAMP
jgi:hypothetical protein